MKEEQRPEALAVLECETIHQGLFASDEMAKAARITILGSEPIPPGRFLVAIGGAVGEVDASYRRGLETAGPLFDRLFLPEVHEGVLTSLRPGSRNGAVDALGLLEAGSCSACLDGVDRALKGAGVRCLGTHLTRGIAGKAFAVFEGRQDMVEAALGLGEERARAHGRFVGTTLLARPDEEMVKRILAFRWGFLEGAEIL